MMDTEESQDFDLYEPYNNFLNSKPQIIQASASSRQVKLIPLRNKESKIEKSPRDKKSISQVANEQSPDSPNAKTRAANRFQTLRIFQQKSEVVLPSSKNKEGRRGPESQIKYTDSVETIKSLIDKGRKEFKKQQKKKQQAKGTMYVNDLWAQGYQREVVKQARIDTDLEAEKKALIEAAKKQFPPNLTQTRNKSEESLPELKSSLSPLNNQYFIRPSSKPMIFDIESNIYFKEEQPRKSKKNLEALKISEEQYDIDNYGMKPIFHKNILQTGPRPSQGSLNNNNQLEKLPLNKRLGANHGHFLRVPGNEEFELSDRNHFVLTPTSTSREAFSPRYSRSIRTRTDRQNKNQKVVHSLDNERDTSREGSNDQRFASFNRDLEATKTRMFIEGKYDQVNELIDYCEAELQERDQWVGMIQNLKNLFLNEKFDKSKRLQFLQKNTFIRDCKALLQKRNQNRWGNF